MYNMGKKKKPAKAKAKAKGPANLKRRWLKSMVKNQKVTKWLQKGFKTLKAALMRLEESILKRLKVPTSKNHKRVVLMVGVLVLLLVLLV